MLAQTRGGYGRLQDFGVRFGYERVILHVEPQARAGRLECNTARTLLLLDHEPCRGPAGPRRSPPRCPRRSSDSRNAPPARRRPTPRGHPRPHQRNPAALSTQPVPPNRPESHSATEPATARPGSEPTGAPTENPASPSTEPAAHPAHTSVEREPDRRLVGSRPPADDPDDDVHSPTIIDLPDVAWVSARDATRAPGDLEDQAARYHPGRRELTINADFRAITDLIAHWRGPLSRRPRRPRGNRGAGPGMVRTGLRRGRARRPELTLDRGAARRAPLAELVHRRPAAKTAAALNAPEAAWSEARSTPERPWQIGARR